MRIMIIKPPPHPGTIRMERLISIEPLELEYLYTALKRYNPQVIDLTRTRKNPLPAIKAYRPDLVLFTSYITHIDQVKEDARIIKTLFPRCLIFVGGPHAEVCPQHFKSPHIDAVFFTSSLEPLQKAVKRAFLNQPFHDLEGLAVSTANGFTINSYPEGKLPVLPAPDRIIFNANPGLFHYLYFKMCASVKTAYGCTGRCRFCFCTVMNRGCYTARPIEDVVAEIEALKGDSVLLLDDNFLINPERLKEFARLIGEKKIKKNFIAYGSASFAAREKELLRKLKAAGLKMLIIGFEYIDENMLKKANKESTRLDNDQAAKNLEELDIDLVALFMIGPGHSHAYFIRLFRYIRNSPIKAASFSTETPLPGSANCPVSPDGDENEPLKKWWRYDLLRLHEKPKRMSAFTYYLWLCLLFFAPFTRAKKLSWLARKYSFGGALSVLVKMALTGAAYLFKLLFYR